MLTTLKVSRIEQIQPVRKVHRFDSTESVTLIGRSQPPEIREYGPIDKVLITLIFVFMIFFFATGA